MIEGILRCTIDFQDTDSIDAPTIANIVHGRTKIYLKLKVLNREYSVFIIP